MSEFHSALDVNDAEELNTCENGVLNSLEYSSQTTDYGINLLNGDKKESESNNSKKAKPSRGLWKYALLFRKDASTDAPTVIEQLSATEDLPTPDSKYMLLVFTRLTKIRLFRKNFLATIVTLFGTAQLYNIII